MNLREILKRYDQVKERTKMFFLSKSYKEVEEKKVTDKCDPSTLFIGSTISVMKPLLTNGINKKYFMIQRCLRNRNLPNYSKEKCVINWSSFFYQMGILAPYNCLGEVLKDICDYLEKVILFKKDQIIISVHERDTDIYDAIKKLDLSVPVENTNESLSYFRHHYGLENVIGRNININVKTNDKKIVPIANLNIMENCGNPIAIEFGLGFGVCFAALDNISSSLDESIATCIKVKIKDKIEKSNMIDALSVLANLCRFDVWPGGKGQHDISKQYFRYVSKIIKKHSLNFNEIINGMLKYETYEYNGPSLIDCDKLKLTFERFING